MSEKMSLEVTLPECDDAARDWHILQRIATEINITADHVICHPRLGKVAMVQDELRSCFQVLPPNLQHQYIVTQLRSVLYTVYYCGLEHQLSSETLNQNSSASLVNEIVGGPGSLFFQELHHQNLGQGYFDHGWLIVGEELDGKVKVCKENLTIWTERERHFRSSERHALTGDYVAVQMPRNQIEKNSYVAIGDAGPVPAISSPGEQNIDLYFNLEAEGATVLIQIITKHLNRQSIPFALKVPYTPDAYQSCDSALLRLKSEDYPGAWKILESSYPSLHPHLRSLTPFFTKTLAAGIGFAEQPRQHFTLQENFGLNRCNIIAIGLLTACQEDSSVETRMAAILHSLEHFRVNLQSPYLNN